MYFSPTLRYFHKNNARNIIYMAVLIFLKNLDLRKNTYSPTTSWRLNLRLTIENMPETETSSPRVEDEY